MPAETSVVALPMTFFLILPDAVVASLTTTCSEEVTVTPDAMAETLP